MALLIHQSFNIFDWSQASAYRVAPAPYRILLNDVASTKTNEDRIAVR